jgi:hypothetical protein
MNNWKQELYSEINAIADVNANPAELVIYIEGVKDFFSGTVEIFEFRRKMTVKAPVPVSVKLIDGSNVLSGDFTCTVDFMQLKGAFSTQSGDPPLTINGVPKVLEDLRPVTASGNWGLDPGDDRICIGGDEWQIVGVQGEKYLDGEPAIIRLTLRK